MATIPVQEDKAQLDLDDGVHIGHIVNAEVNERKGYKYLDLTLGVHEEGEPQTIKTGYPLPMSPSSMTGMLFKRFGVDVTPGTDVNTETLVNKRVQFITVKGEKYIEVDRKSVKPVPKEAL